MNHSLPSQSSRSKRTIVYILIFLLIAIAGLAYLKWIPYYSKSILAITSHSIGDSILGDPSESGSSSWEGAWSYASDLFQFRLESGCSGYSIGLFSAGIIAGKLVAQSTWKNFFWQHGNWGPFLTSRHDVYLLCCTSCCRTTQEKCLCRG